jgi:hypothetical protein
MTSPITPSNGSGRALSLTSSAIVLKTPLTDEKIWKRLKEAGFDEESVKRRDKAALIAYIANLEAEVCFLLVHFFLIYCCFYLNFLFFFFTKKEGNGRKP